MIRTINAAAAAAITTITLLALLIFALMLSVALAQDVVVVAEPLPDDIDTWAELVAYWLPKVIQGALAIAGTVLAFMLRKAVALLPTFIQTYVDTKRQRDLHSAVMSKVAELMKEGRWPTRADFTTVAGDLTSALTPQIVEEIREYVVRYNPQAAEWADVVTQSAKGTKLLRTLAMRKAAELTGDPLTAALQKAGQPAVQP